MGDSHENRVLSELHVMEAIRLSFESQFERFHGSLGRVETQLRSRIDELEQSTQELVAKFRGLEESVLDSNELVNSLVLSSTAAANLKRTTSPTNGVHLQSLDYFLKPSIIAAVFGHSISKFIVDACCADGEADGKRCVRIMLFAPPPLERKRARQGGDGLHFVEMRFKVMKNALFNCRKVAMGGQIESEFSRGREERESARYGEEGFVFPRNNSEGGRRTAVRAPKWLDRDFITLEDMETYKKEIISRELRCESVRQGSEDRTSASYRGPALKRRRTSQSKDCGNGDLAKDILKAIWKRGTDWFSTARGEAPKAFTRHFGFIFYTDCKARWNYKDDRSYAERVGEVPEAVNSRMVEGEGSAAELNIAKLKSMGKNFPSLEVEASFLVEIFKSEDEKSDLRKKGETKRLHTTVSLIDGAIHFATGYFQSPSSEGYLARSSESIRLVFLIAICFSEILDEIHSKLDRGSSEAEAVNIAKEYGLIIPQDNLRNSIILEHVVRKTKQEYDAANRNTLGGSSRENFTTRAREIDSDDDDVVDLTLVEEY